MNIKDIANLSGVSVSTVSKIMNNKADSLAEETKRKVLRIAKEHRYTPYAAFHQQGRRYLLALVTHLGFQSLPLIRHLEAAAAERGYKIILVNAGDNGRPVEEHLAILRDTVDGAILLQPDLPPSAEARATGALPPAVIIDGDAGATRLGSAVTEDWRTAAQLAVEHLELHGHRRIGLLASEGRKSSELRASVESHYSERETPFDHKLAVGPDTLPALIQAGATAVICADPGLAGLLYDYAWRNDLVIPQDLSVVTLTHDEPGSFQPPLTTVRLDAGNLARRTLETLTALIEGRAAAPEVAAPPRPIPGESVAAPASDSASAPPILVVGSLNLDVMMTVPVMPSTGDTVMIDEVAALPGGKGANQAVGVARLGGRVSLIGRIGRDGGGKTVYNALRAHGVDTRAVSVDRQVETGQAYINVSPGGDSFIEVFSGANQRLAARHLEKNEALFRAARYCLIQSELPREIFTLAVKFAHRHGAKVIFKPCSLAAIAPSLLKKIHLLAPNRKEAARLAGADKNLAEQAAFFLDHGVDEVIITLDAGGCYHRSKNAASHYPAYAEKRLKPVDATGASDAFLSALAVALSEGRPMDIAIRFANVAAGLSVLERGAQPSLPDRGLLEMRKKAWLPHSR